MCFPKNKKPDDISLRVIQAFQKVENGIDSATHKKQTSDEALAKIRPELEACGFHVEKQAEGGAYPCSDSFRYKRKDRKVL